MIRTVDKAERLALLYMLQQSGKTVNTKEFAELTKQALRTAQRDFQDVTNIQAHIRFYDLLQK